MKIKSQTRIKPQLCQQWPISDISFNNSCAVSNLQLSIYIMIKKVHFLSYGNKTDTCAILKQ